ncbi:MAG: hypothetical protein QG599_2547 [Pseudomonadota bacterium]|nr:hypothetical protein [Pseudomonadota bacterium]
MKPLFFALALALSLPWTAWALDKEPYSPERFAALQAENRLVLVDIFATWCPTCAKQAEVLKAYRAQHPEVALHILEVDFDQDKEAVKRFRAPRQSTLLLYRGEEQLWFSVAETGQEAIFAAINQGAKTP